MNTKFFNDAVIGNKNIKATFSDRGEMLRIYYPNVDYKQFVDTFQVGLKINDSAIVYLHEDINNKYNQYYTENTNILNTEIENICSVCGVDYKTTFPITSEFFGPSID